MGVDVCKLTGTRGRYVRAHILPRAFTDRNLDKAARIEWGQFGSQPALRHTSWYDEEIVTAEGENILRDIDTKAANVIQRYGLCWRHFPLSPAAKRDSVPGTDFELIKLEKIDSASLRRFFLSILWRSAVSRRVPFREIRLDLASLSKLTKIVRGDVEPSDSDFPTVLVLLTTRGQPHNLTPLRQRMKTPQLEGKMKAELKIFRFFVDGLVAHMGRKSMDKSLADVWGKRLLGVSEPTILLGRPYEGSWQEANLDTLQNELERTWPGRMDKIFGAVANG